MCFLWTCAVLCCLLEWNGTERGVEWSVVQGRKAGRAILHVSIALWSGVVLPSLKTLSLNEGILRLPSKKTANSMNEWIHLSSLCFLLAGRPVPAWGLEHVCTGVVVLL